MNILRKSSGADRLTLMGLRLVEDDFSWKVVSDNDPQFWIRVEKDADAGWVWVSDLTPSDQDDTTTATALAAVLDVADAPFDIRIRFKDVVSQGVFDADAHAHWQGFLSLVAAQSGRFLEELSTEMRRDKTDVIAQFD